MAKLEMEMDAVEPITIDLPTYRQLLKDFDAAVCEALAVGQASANRFEAPYIGYTTKVFARLCAYAQSLVRASPRSRWTKTDADHWEFGAVAGYARAIMEGLLLFTYISKDPESPDEWSTRLLVMHLNDCTRRVQLFATLGQAEQELAHVVEAEDLKRRLLENPWFNGLSDRRQKELLSGKPLTVSSREQQVEAAGLEKDGFDALWQLFSQYAHILPLSFYRMEPNGRGTGLLNDTDIAYIGMALDASTKVMVTCTDRMVEFFPDTSPVRQGVGSKFSPGPRANLPKHAKRKGK
ncbi:MAG: hypothetical protein ACOH2L_15980 [Devosia sp.]